MSSTDYYSSYSSYSSYSTYTSYAYTTEAAGRYN